MQIYTHILSYIPSYLYFCTFISLLKVVGSHQYLEISSDYQDSFCTITVTYSVNLPLPTTSLIYLCILSIPMCVYNESPVATRPTPSHHVDVLQLGPWYPVLDWYHLYPSPHMVAASYFPPATLHSHEQFSLSSPAVTLWTVCSPIACLSCFS